ncbi:hypothetical protein [Geothrix sp.]|jgi:hypothetical protein|uniref:hypothetical protein n=1 Tax=Geothrix sp. TaxID=1962974 RepID=UPI0025B99215|nr:hypothetical protein [Geothrix sp.]
MDILTLELLDVTVFQALLELRSLLAEQPGVPLRILGEDEMLRINVAGFLEKQGRVARLVQQGPQWELLVAAGAVPSPLPASAPPPPAPPALPPVLLLRSAFAPGDRALGRRLLLETLSHLDSGTPWVGLAHQAVELLEDPLAVAAFETLQARGIPVRVSAASLAHAGAGAGAGTGIGDGTGADRFELMADAVWQKLLARGGVTVL